MTIITLSEFARAKCEQLEDAERRVDRAVGFQRRLEAEKEELQKQLTHVTEQLAVVNRYYGGGL